MASTAPPDPLPSNRNIGPMLVGVSIAFIIPTVVTTALRIWTRIREKTFGLDDYTIVFATALTVVLSALSIEAVAYGKGRHVWYLSEEQQAKISMLSWANQIVLFCAICMIKTSICLLILRIKSTTWLLWIIYTTIALLVLTAIMPITALCVECKPVSGFWNRTADGVTCTAPDFRIYSIYVQSAYSIFTDFMCSVLPVFIVWQLQVSRKKKIGVCLLMSMGLVCTAFAALRAASLSTDISDTTWTYTYTGIWMTIECNLGILAANLAPLRVLIIRIFPKLKTQYSHNQYEGGGIRMFFHPATARGSQPARHSQGMPSRTPGVNERWPRKTLSFGSDQSELPLHDVLKTREARLEYTEAQSSSNVGDEIERRPWDRE